MAVKYCYLCNQTPGKRPSIQALAEGIVCPVCYQPTCRTHLVTVRWRWRSSGQTDSALICQECRRSYKHRDWDRYNRDWIT